MGDNGTGNLLTALRRVWPLFLIFAVMILLRRDSSARPYAIAVAVMICFVVILWNANRESKRRTSRERGN
jgi:L-asparagine transporter-like permease